MLTQQASIWLTLMFDSAISSAVIAGGLWNMTKVLPFICNAIRSVKNDWIVKLRKTFANTSAHGSVVGERLVFNIIPVIFLLALKFRQSSWQAVAMELFE